MLSKSPLRFAPGPDPMRAVRDTGHAASSRACVEPLPGMARRPRGSRLSLLGGGARAAQGDGSALGWAEADGRLPCRRARGGAGWAGKAGGWANLGPDTSPDKENYYSYQPTSPRPANSINTSSAGRSANPCQKKHGLRRKMNFLNACSLP